MNLKKMLTIASIMMFLVAGVAGCAGETNQDADKAKGVEEGKETEVIKFGLITPTTGDLAQYGIGVKNASEMAMEQINADGGINGKLLKLIPLDNKGDVTESINIFNRLVENDGIHALVGPVISSTSLAVAPIAEEKGIPMVTPTATNIDVTPNHNYVFRACYLDLFQGGTVAKFASENLGAKKAAILYDSGDDYSNGLAEAFKATFEEAGGEIVNYEGFTGDDKDFKSVLTKIKENAPEVIFIPAYFNTVGLIAGQIAEVGIDAQLLGADGWDSIQNNYGDLVEGGFFANHYATDDESELVQGFVTSYEEKYGETPNALAALAYDATYILADAFIKAETTEGSAIVEALKATDKDFVTGHITFDEDGNPIKNISMITIKDGKLKLETKIGQ